MLTSGGPVQLLVLAGAVSPTDSGPVRNDDLATAAAGLPCIRIVDVQVRRSDDGAQVFPVVVPALPPTCCDDWNDFVLRLGGLPGIDDGTLLARTVRTYFANGEARCYIVTIRRPRFDDAVGLEAAIEDLVGSAGASEADATGLERLLCLFEVAIADAPDLNARQVDLSVRTLPLPPLDVDACFRTCSKTFGAKEAVTAAGAFSPQGPIFADDAVIGAQRAMILRCAPERWRVLLLLAAPVGLDPSTGEFHGRDADGAITWRKKLDKTWRADRGTAAHRAGRRHSGPP